MNKKLKMMLENINDLKAQVKQLVADGKLSEAEAKKKELVDAQREFDILYDLDDKEPTLDGKKPLDDPENHEDPEDPEKGAPNAKQVGHALVDLIRAKLGGKAAPEKAVKVLTKAAKMKGLGMSEGVDADGGLTVPEDVATSIRELRRASADDLELYVNVENVSTMSGSRPVEVEADTTAWPEVAEGGTFNEQATPTMTEVKYKIRKFGGILKVTRELLEDTAENILGYLKKWIAKKTRATRNAEILKALETCFSEVTYEVKTLDELKEIFNVVLDPAVAAAGRVITNQTGYNWLDNLKTTDGKYALQPDPTAPTKKLLFGAYPVVTLSNKVLKNTQGSLGDEGKTIVPLICGCTEDAVTLFDRNALSLDVSNTAGDLWTTDKTGLKVRDRFDTKAVDKKAVVKGVIKITTAG